MRSAGPAGVAAGLCALLLASCGGGGSGGGPSGPTIGAADPNQGRQASPVGNSAAQQPRAQIGATGVVAKATTLLVSSLYYERNNQRDTVAVGCNRLACEPRAGVLGDVEIGLDTVRELAASPVLVLHDSPSPREGIEWTGLEAGLEDYIGAWMSYGGFGIRSDRTGQGARLTDARFGMAFGQDAVWRVTGRERLPRMTWKGHMVALQPWLSFWETAIHGDVELRLAGVSVDAETAQAGDPTGADMFIDFTGMKRLRDGKAIDPGFFFAGIPVWLDRVESVPGEQQAEDAPPEKNVTLRFGGGLTGSLISGRFYGPDMEEVAGVFEQNSYLGAFGANSEDVGAQQALTLAGGKLVSGIGDERVIEDLTPGCGGGSCGIVVDSLERQVDLDIDDTAGRDFGPGHDLKSVDGVRQANYGGWGQWSSWMAGIGTQEGLGGDDEGFEFVLTASSGFPSNSNPVSGTGTWEGRMTGAAYDETGIGPAVTGSTAIVADFTTGLLDVTISGIAAVEPSDDGSWGDLVWEGVPMAVGAFSGDRGLRGRFYGPTHQEVGGVFDSGADGGENAIAGAFGARRGGNGN